MNAIVKILDTVVTNGLRVVKVLRMGRKEALTAKQLLPPGMDANPIAGMTAVFAPSVNGSERVILGYFNKSVLADKGEMRIFSQDSSGNVVAYMWLKKTSGAGMMELCGTADNVVRWSALNTAVQNDIVAFINAQLPLIAAGIAAGGGSYTPSTMNVNLNAAKVAEIKTP